MEESTHESNTAQALLPLSQKRGRNLCQEVATLYRLQQRSTTPKPRKHWQEIADYDWIAA